MKTEVANSENDIFDMQSKLEKLGMVADFSAEAPESHKAKAYRELDEKIEALESEKRRVSDEIK